MNGDRRTLVELERLLRSMDLAELLRFCEGTLRAAGLSQRVLLERFPDAWKQFDDDVEAGRIGP